MSTLSLRLRYRPLRLGWCVAQGDFDGFRKAVRSSFTMWGGRFNPVIPLGSELADALVRLFRVDALVPMSSNPAVAEFLKRHDYLPWPMFHEGLFIDHGQGRIAPQIADLSHPIAKIYEDSYKNNPNPQPCVDLYGWDDTDPLADIFLSSYGSTLTKEESGTDYPGLIRQHLLAGPSKIIANGAEIPPIDPTRMLLSVLCRTFLGRHYAVQNNWDYPGFYIGHANNFDDLVNFWNLRAADIALQFYDLRFANRFQHLKRFWSEAVPTLFRDGGATGKVALWHRRDFDIGDRSQFGENLTDCAVDAPMWNGLNIQAPVMYFAERSALGAVSNSDGKTHVSFALNDRPFVGEWSSRGQHYVLSVDPGIGLYRNEGETLHAPFIPELNQFYGRQLHHSWNEARSEPESVGLVLPISSDDLSLQGLQVPQLIAEIFRVAGIAALPSRSGLVADSLIRQMGGLSGCRPFKIAGVRSLIENHRPDQSFSRSTAMQTIRGQGKDRPLSDYQWLYIEPRDLGSQLKNDAVLAYLLDKGVFRAGLKFDCPSCRLEFWRSLDEAASRVECEYCGHNFNVTSQLRDKDWAFRRSGLFGRNDHQEGAIPVMLTLQQLTKMHGLDHSIFTTATTLAPAGAAIHECETDFIVVTGGRGRGKVQIAIGECKTRLPINADDVRNLVAIADALPADRYDVFIVFARLTPFSSEEINLIRPVNSGRKRRAILLTERELEPMLVYERTEKEFDVQRSAVSFENMATVTDRVFFQNARRD